MSDHFRHGHNPSLDLRRRTEVFEKKLRLGKRLITGYIVFSLCAAGGVLYVVGHFIAKVW
jgi:hypothetical protein